MSEMKYFASNDGYQLAYQDAGLATLPPLILVFKRNIPALSKHYRVIAPDLRGHGASDKPPHSFHVSRLAMDLHNLLSHLELSATASVRCIAGSLGCAILWCYAELFTADVFSHQIWVDQAPMQNYAFDGSWGPAEGNRGMNCEEAVKGLFVTLKDDPDAAYRGTIAACLGYRSHPIEGQVVSKETWDKDEAFFLAEARRGVPEWYGELMKDHTALDWRWTITECFGGRKENRTKVLVVATERSGCFPAKGPMAAVDFANEKSKDEDRRAEGVVIEWGGHWCYWEDPERFDKLVLKFLFP